jgi:hypothetical protein
MMSWRTFTVSTLIFCGTISVSAATQHRPVRKVKAKPPVAQPQPQTPQQQAPPQPPPTPEQGPSSPPDVTYRGGQLTILARNSTLGDVLNAVRSKTGASIDMPAPSGERVVGQFGPGAPREVVAQLLNGSHFDYVLMGSAADPGSLKKVVLTARANGPEPAPQPQNNQPQAFNQGGENENAPQMEPDQAAEDNSTDVQPEQPPQVEQEEPQGQQPPNPGGGPVVKTPEQLLRELQQQQQQQQNQGQPPQQ